MFMIRCFVVLDTSDSVDGDTKDEVDVFDITGRVECAFEKLCFAEDNDDFELLDKWALVDGALEELDISNKCLVLDSTSSVGETLDVFWDVILLPANTANTQTYEQ